MSSASTYVRLFDMNTHPDGPLYPFGNLFKSRRGTISLADQEKIRMSCYAENIRGYSTWRSCNDGHGHHPSKNQLDVIWKARCQEQYVYQAFCTELRRLGIDPDDFLDGPDFEHDNRAHADMMFTDSNGYRWKIEVKGSGDSERNGYVFQAQRKCRRTGRLFYCSPFFNPSMKGTPEWLEDSRTLVFCVKDYGNGVYGPDVVWGRMLRDLVFADPIRRDLHGLKTVVYNYKNRQMCGTPLQLFVL